MIKKIKVAIDIRDLRIAKTGAKTYLEELCKEFRKDDDDFEFVFIDTDFPVYTGKSRFLKLIEQSRFLLWKQLILPLKAWTRQCDIVFCTDYFVPCWKGGFLTIPVFHDAFLWEYPEHYNRYWLRSFYLLGVGAAKTSAFIVTSSYYSKERIASYSGIPSEKIIPVYEAPKSLAAPLQVKEIMISDEMKDVLSGNYLLHVGTFEKRKNLPALINAFAQLRQQGYPDLVLVLIGQASPKKDMDDSANIMDLINRKELQNHVFMPGYVSDGVLDLFYQRANLYVFPSRNEGFGIPILEAFSYGLPVIVANNSCLPEIAGDAALSFDPDDPNELCSKIRSLLEDEGLRKDLIKKMDSRIALFSWERSASEIKNIFRKAYSAKQAGKKV